MRGIPLLLFFVFCAAATPLNIQTNVSDAYTFFKWSTSLNGRITTGLQSSEDIIWITSNGLKYTPLDDDLYTWSTVSGDGKWIAALNVSGVSIYDSSLANQLFAFIQPPCRRCNYGVWAAINELIYLSDDGAHLVISVTPPIDLKLPISTFYFYQRNGNRYDLLFSSNTTLTAMAFSSSMTKFIGYGPTDNQDRIELFKGTVDFKTKTLNKQKINTLETKALIKMTLALNDMALLVRETGEPLLLKPNGQFLQPWDYKTDLNGLLSAVSDDGKYYFAFENVEEGVTYNVMRRYLIGERKPMSFDRVKIHAVGEAITVSSDGRVLVAATSGNMSYSTLAGGGVSSICAVSSDCNAGLKCGRSSYCYKEGMRADAPRIVQLSAKNGLLVIKTLPRDKTNPITCEKAGSTSAGAYVSYTNNKGNFFEFNNTFVDISYALHDGTNSTWRNLGYVKNGEFQQMLGFPQSGKMMVRVRVTCADAQSSGEIVRVVKVPYDVIHTRTKKGGGSVIVWSASLIVMALLII